MSWELFGKEIILGKRKGVLPSVLLPLLTVCSFFYGIAVTLRNTLFDWGLLKATRVEGTFVVSVGNITAGGSGKTPFVMALLQALGEKKVGVLSRGFRGGDESRMIKERFSSVENFVDPNRIRGALAARDRGHNLLVLDDGMQHRKLKRDIDVVVVGGESPFGGGRYLPRGLLRDSKRSLRRADYVVLHRTPAGNTVIEEIKKFTQAPLIVTDLKVRKVGALNGENINLNDQKVGLFCGIGYPEQFAMTVKGLGCSVVDHLFLPDHKAPEVADLKVFAKACRVKGATYLVCTEKDRVKINRDLELALPVACVEADMEVISGKEVFSKLIQRMECSE